MSMLQQGASASIFAPVEVVFTERDDGCHLLESPFALGPYPGKIGEFLYHWAEREPDACFLAERGADGKWRRLSYGEALIKVEALGQSLINRGLNAERPVMILSGNSIETALLTLAAMHVGVPAAPVSPAYSLMSRDYVRLKHVCDLLRPGLIYAASAETFGGALAAVRDSGAEVISADGAGELVDGALSELLATVPGPELRVRYAQVGPDTVGKILFTSGSTGLPKGVINTQRMLCSNQQAIAQAWPFIEQERPIIVDWLPWHHTFGGNHNFNLMLRNGGALYIDQGKPMPGLIEESVKNLREISPTLYFNVPGGFQALLPYLEGDEALRDMFFRRLKLIFYAAASLPQTLWERLEKLSIASLGYKVPMVSAWGATETAPLVTIVHYPIDRAGVIGVPAPGCQLKLVPQMGKWEIRVKGPNVTPGYWKNSDQTRQAFDEEGYYKIGDAVRLADPTMPEKGVVFDGRIGENFKLTSGTWVHVGELRLKLIEAAAPVIQDCVITGHDRDELGVLVFPSEAGCRHVAGETGAALQDKSLWSCEAVVNHLRRALQEHNRNSGGNSNRISRCLILTQPPSLDAGEITDKGYINQARVLECRAELVEQLYADGEGVLRL
ncbi:MAG TPA: feruloyl-CoA synthase [Gammaproteobacteria bacterium]|nr:feruloyl-CoA synthase [Gammaproteobacteria bacterium]